MADQIAVKSPERATSPDGVSSFFVVLVALPHLLSRGHTINC